MAIACKEGNSDIAYQLIAAGAYVNHQDRGGDTNLILASKGGHKAIVEALLKRYADVDTRVRSYLLKELSQGHCNHGFSVRTWS